MKYAEYSAAIGAAVKRFVDEHYDEMREDCVNDMLGNSVFEIFRRIYCRNHSCTHVLDVEALNTIADYVVDYMMDLGYEYERDEIAWRCLDGYRYAPYSGEWHDGDPWDPEIGTIRKCDDGYEATLEHNGRVTHLGKGETPQEALDNARMVFE